MKLGQCLLFRCILATVLLISSLCISPFACSQDALAKTIDALIDRDFDPLISPRESDGLLLRRLSLDLRSVVPTQAELDEYFADTEVNRWSRWVNRFLNDPLHRERLVDWLDKSLMQRRPHKYVDRTKWLSYLRQAVDDRKPLDSIIREVVASPWWNSSQRAQQRFFLDREGDSHAVARDVGRIFFGRDMQCAQCHDHPHVDEYLQIDYHGLLAFVSAGSLVEAKFKDDKGAEQKIQIYAERAAGDAAFESVFDKGVFFRTGARVPGVTEQLEDYHAPDQRYQAAPMPDSLDGAPKPPLLSRRGLLVTQLSIANRAFSENWSNRIWAMMLGRGLVHPLDMHHADNPASNPPLLHALSQSLINSGYNMTSLLEQIALSETYQRAGRLPIESSLRNRTVLNLPTELLNKFALDVSNKKTVLESEIASLTAAADTAKQQMDDAKTLWRSAQKERVTVRADLDKAEAAFNEVKKKLDEANAALEKTNKQRDDLNTRIKLLEEAASQLEKAKALSAGEDPELAQAISTAKMKAETSKAALPPIEKVILDNTTARDAKSTLLEAERGRIQEVVERLKPVEQSLLNADITFVAARAKWQGEHSRQVLTGKRVDQLSRIQSWITQSQNVFQTESEHAIATQSRDRHQGTLNSLAEQQSGLNKTIAEATIALEVVRSKRSIAQEKRTKLNDEIGLLQSTVELINKSAALVSDAESFESAKQSIATSQEMKRANLSIIQSEIDSIETEFFAKSQGVTAMSMELAKLESQRVKEVELLEQESQSVLAKFATVQQAIETCGTQMHSVLEDRQSNSYAAQFRALSPEQLGLSVLRATKVLDNYIAAEAAEIEKQSPLAADATQEQRDTKTLQATRQALDKLRPNIDVFANLYASGVGQTSDEFFASPDQALYMSNGGSVFQWSAASGNNVTGLVVQQLDTSEAARILYLSLLSREPTAQEQQWVSEQLAKAADKKPAIAQELVWGLLTSSEFRVYP